VVEVFRNDGTSEKAEEFGEVIFDDGQYFAYISQIALSQNQSTNTPPNYKNGIH